MRMEFADHVADRARGFLVFRTGGKAQFAHRIDNAPLHRLEPVADMRQRPIENDIHRIIEVRALGEFLQRLALYPFEIELLLLHTWARFPLLSSHSRRSLARFLASSMSIS